MSKAAKSHHPNRASADPPSPQLHALPPPQQRLHRAEGHRRQGDPRTPSSIDLCGPAFLSSRSAQATSGATTAVQQGYHYSTSVWTCKVRKKAAQGDSRRVPVRSGPRKGPVPMPLNHADQGASRTGPDVGPLFTPNLAFQLPHVAQSLGCFVSCANDSWRRALRA